MKRCAYVDKAELKALLYEWRCSGATFEDRCRAMSPRLAEILRTIIRQTMFSPKFVRYFPGFKEDMESEAFLKCVRYLDKADPEKNPHSYMIAAAASAALDWYRKQRRSYEKKKEACRRWYGMDENKIAAFFAAEEEGEE